jgi:hypothetical protein
MFSDDKIGNKELKKALKEGIVVPTKQTHIPQIYQRSLRFHRKNRGTQRFKY